MVPQSSLPGVLFIVPIRELEGRLFAQNTFARSIVSAENMSDVGGRKQYARTFGLLIRVMAGHICLYLHTVTAERVFFPSFFGLTLVDSVILP